MQSEKTVLFPAFPCPYQSLGC